jgi:hypothetical protein
MRNIDVILEALYVLDIPHEEFETKCRLKKGLLLELVADTQIDLTKEELDRISEAYSCSFKDVGYHFLSNTLFSPVLITKDRINID